MNKMTYLKNLPCLFFIFIASIHNVAAMESPAGLSSPCVRAYAIKVAGLGFFDKKKKAGLKATLNLFRMLEHQNTNFSQIAEPHYKWWESSDFSRWPFFHLLALYRSGVLCEETFYTIDKIISNFPELIMLPKVSSIIEVQEKILETDEIKRKKAERKRQEKDLELANHAIRAELIDRLKREGRPLYSMYVSDDDADDEVNSSDISVGEKRGVETRKPDKEDECLVCLTAFKKKGGKKEKKSVRKLALSCKHSFCRDCIKGQINLAISEKSERIKCLAANCHEDLAFDSPDTFHLSFKQECALNKNIIETEIASRKDNYIPCSNKNCAHVFYSPEPFSENDEIRSDNCPYCEQKTCLKCREAFNKGHLCSAVLLTQKTEERKIRKKGVYMDCPYCGVWHEKEVGCSFVKCSSCKRNYDFATGGPWDADSERRQKAAAKGKGFHPASHVEKSSLIKNAEDFVDGKEQW